MSRVEGVGCGVQGVGCRVEGVGCRVETLNVNPGDRSGSARAGRVSEVPFYD